MCVCHTHMLHMVSLSLFIVNGCMCVLVVCVQIRMVTIYIFIYNIGLAERLSGAEAHTIKMVHSHICMRRS
jgi:hypothetical protein